MHITEIVVSAGRTLPHPCESYANLRPNITLKASLTDSDDPVVCTKQLQVQAERLVEEHAAVLVASIQEREVSQRQSDELRRLEQSIVDGQHRVDELRQKIEQRSVNEVLQTLF